jgi:hypothetical protein
MSQENVELPTRVTEGASRAAGVLVRYRHHEGGLGTVDQRLTVFEDGAVKLDERHRTRDPVLLRLDAAELDRVRAALNQIPGQLWARGPELALVKIKSRFTSLWKEEFEDYGSFFELKRDRHAIAGEDPTAADIRVEAVVTLLDAFRIQAIRAEPR